MGSGQWLSGVRAPALGPLTASREEDAGRRLGRRERIRLGCLGVEGEGSVLFKEGAKEKATG
jgi:hypothetical protein